MQQAADKIWIYLLAWAPLDWIRHRTHSVDSLEIEFAHFVIFRLSVSVRESVRFRHTSGKWTIRR